MRHVTGRWLARFTGLACVLCFGTAHAAYFNFESSQVHPVALTPSGGRLLALNTPDGTLEIFTVSAGGALTRQAAVPVGLEPVSVRALSDTTAWVANHLSDTVSIVDLALGTVVRTLPTGDEPNDVVFAAGKAFVAVGGEDAVRVFDLSDLTLQPQTVLLAGSRPRALAVSASGAQVYAVVQDSGNQTTVVNANVIATNNGNSSATRLAALGQNNITCNGRRRPTRRFRPASRATRSSLIRRHPRSLPYR